MSSIEHEIDDLFRGPLADFVAARNALAKRAGAQAARVKALQKPNVPAWAVNQLYWRKRHVFDRLVAASLAVRSAYGAQFAGRASDVQKAEAAHREAEHVALDEIRQMLRVAGESESTAILDALRATLAALPAEEAAGRLTRPLKPSGFEALAGIVALAPTGPRPVRHLKVAVAPEATASQAARGRAAEQAEVTAREQAKARRHEIVELEKALKEARADEAAAARAVAGTRSAIETASQERKRLQQALTDVVDRAHQLSRDAAAQEAASQAAARTRESLERRLSTLTQQS